MWTQTLKCMRHYNIRENNRFDAVWTGWTTEESAADSRQGPHPAYLIGTRRCFPGDKAEGAWSWPLTSTTPYVMVVCLITDRNNFAFIFTVCNRTLNKTAWALCFVLVTKYQGNQIEDEMAGECATREGWERHIFLLENLTGRDTLGNLDVDRERF
jgi:hypothetical protein